MKQVKGTYTIRPQTEASLREYAKESGHSMSLIVDLAVEEYITKKRKGDKE